MLVWRASLPTGFAGPVRCGAQIKDNGSFSLHSAKAAVSRTFGSSSSVRQSGCALGSGCIVLSVVGAIGSTPRRTGATINAVRAGESRDAFNLRLRKIVRWRLSLISVLLAFSALHSHFYVACPPVLRFHPRICKSIDMAYRIPYAK